MGFFDGIETVDPSGASPRFPPDGDFIARVHECRVHQGQWGTRFIAECDVIQSSMPEVPSGSRRSWTVQIDGAYSKIGLGEVKSFMAVCHGIDPTNTEEVNGKISKPVVDGSITPAQPLRGRVVRTSTSQKSTKAGQEITKHLWHVVDATIAAGLGITMPPTGLVPAPVTAPLPPGMQPPPPVAPPPPIASPPAAAFPPVGWTKHPHAPGHYYKGQEVKTEAELRAMVTPAAPPPPPVAPPPPIAAPPAFPPAGWTIHPNAPGHFYKGQDVRTEFQLRELAARGAA